MANSILHASSIGPIKHARYTIVVPTFDGSGAPTDPTTPDTELVIDGAASTDAAEELSASSGLAGGGIITLSGSETNATNIVGQVKNASGPKVGIFVVTPRVLPIWKSGTASAGAASTITLPATFPSIPNFFAGAIVRTTGGTGGGGTGGANNQARMIVLNTILRLCTIEPNFETAPDATTTFDILATPEWLQRVSALGILVNVVVGTSESQFSINIDLSALSAQQIVGRVLQFVGGVNIYAERIIQTASAVASSVVTCKALPGGAPSTNDPAFLR